DVYDGDATLAPEVDIQDELSTEDWDEATARSSAAEDAARAEEESRPGQFIDAEGNIVAEPADDQPIGGDAAASESPESTAGGDPEAGNQRAGSITPEVVLKIRRRRFRM